MGVNFKLSIYSNSNLRPLISKMVMNEIEYVLSTEILLKKGVLVDSSWCVDLVINFVEWGAKYKSKDIFFVDGFRTVKSEKIKLKFVTVPLNIILDSQNVRRAFYSKVIEVVEGFFLSQYKKLTKEDFKILHNDDFINSLEKIDIRSAGQELCYGNS